MRARSISSRRAGIAPLLIVPVRCRSLHHDDQGALEYLVSMRGARLHYLPPCVTPPPSNPPAGSSAGSSAPQPWPPLPRASA